MSNDRFAVSVKDAAGAYVRANDAFINLLGVASADLPGLTDDQVQPRDVAEGLVANDRAALEAAGTLLTEERVFDRLGLRKVAACRFTTQENGSTLLWRVCGPVQQAAEIAAEAERLRSAVMLPAQDEPAPAPPEGPPAPVMEEPLPAVALPEENAGRLAQLEAELAELRSRAQLPDPRMQAALRAMAGVAEALEHPMRIAPAFRAAAERLGSALGFDAVVSWRPGRDGGLVCSSVWTANPDARSFEDECWRVRRAPASSDLTWDPDATEPNGMRTVVTVPVGGAGAIELLAVERREPEPETIQALEAASRQLRIVARLTELADLPRWASISSNATA